MNNASLIVYPTTDLTAAKRFFHELLGSDPYADSPQYVGYKNGDMEIGLVPNSNQSDAVALAYWTVADIAESVKTLVAAGGTVVQDVTDVAYGLLVASVKSPGGATVGLRQFPKK